MASPLNPDRSPNRIRAFLAGLDLHYTVPVVVGVAVFLAVVFVYFGAL